MFIFQIPAAHGSGAYLGEDSHAKKQVVKRLAWTGPPERREIELFFYCSHYTDPDCYACDAGTCVQRVTNVIADDWQVEHDCRGELD